MNKVSLKKKILGLVLAGSISVSLAGTASASIVNGRFKTNPEKYNAHMNTKYVFEKHCKLLNEALVELVEDGKISKDKAGSINEYLDKKSEENRGNSEGTLKKQSLLDELKEQNIITSDEEKLIREEIEEQIDERLKEKLEGLEKKGVLTEKNVKNIVKYYRSRRALKKAELQKMSGMSEEEKKAYIEKMNQKMKSPFEEMVEKKIITKQQADEVKKILNKKHNPMHKNNINNQQPVKENQNNINNEQKPLQENKNNIDNQKRPMEENKNNLNEQQKPVEENKNNQQNQQAPINEKNNRQ